ncbi:hypothetical protein LR48_Vigan04g020200 [Vigna angularis]|uniref:Hydrophobic seed protein domain-containing protein n=1 Tax=Phaseolus angularis TaxID=3914 RepID=A0A0L9UBX0_PHAAN|nr:hypothetical protein LR48_Vigan04g020200 [Vigna angularis]
MGSRQYVGLLLLSLSLLSVSMVRSQSTCPGEFFGACLLFGGSNSTICCSLLQGFSAVQIGICFRNSRALIPRSIPFVLPNVSISTIINTCNITVGS